MSFSKDTYLSLAKAWDEVGRPDALLDQNVYHLLAMRCWFQSAGAEAEGREQVMADYGDACEKLLEETDPNWWGNLLRQREHCDRCGARYMVENLSICTRCYGSYCFECVDDVLAPNGNRLHHDGGEIVG